MSTSSPPPSPSIILPDVQLPEDPGLRHEGHLLVVDVAAAVSTPGAVLGAQNVDDLVDEFAGLWQRKRFLQRSVLSYPDRERGWSLSFPGIGIYLKIRVFF